MHQFSIALTCAFFTLTAHTADTHARPGSDATDTASLRANLDAIRDALDRGALQPELLAEIAADIRRAAARIDTPGGKRQTCVETAYEKFQQSTSDSNAITLAAAGCRGVRDSRCPAVLYDIHARSRGSHDAMLRALSSCREIRNVDDFQWMFKVLSHSMIEGFAADKAAEFARGLHSADGECMRKAYDVLSRWKNPLDALNNASRSCASPE